MLAGAYCLAMYYGHLSGLLCEPIMCDNATRGPPSLEQRLERMMESTASTRYSFDDVVMLSTPAVAAMLFYRAARRD